MSWRSVDVEEQRIRFVVAASRGERPVSALCAEFGVSQATNLWVAARHDFDAHWQ
jgi:hypothetical protein